MVKIKGANITMRLIFRTNKYALQFIPWRVLKCVI